MVDTMERSQANTKHQIKKLTVEKLRQFCDDIFKCNGQRVDLTERGIESILSLEGLQNATRLDLSHNKLTKLSQLKSVAHMTMLKLTDNKLTGDGLMEIQYLKKLVILNAAENNITRIPFEVLRNMGTLKALVLNKNAISTLDWMPKLPELNSLIVSNNRITQIPQRVLDGLPNLTKISISHNLLEEIPNLSKLSQITELRLSHNRIKKVPVHLAQLKNLKVLELSHNQIDDWSGLEALSCLENLRQLNMIGNPIVGKKLEAIVKNDQESGDNSNEDNDNDVEDDNSSNDSESDGEGNRKKKKKKKNNSKTKKASISDEEKQKMKQGKYLDAKHKQYNFKMKRLFPNLVVRDAARVLDKRVHGYVAPLKEEKQRLRKPESSDKKLKTISAGKRKRDKESMKVNTATENHQTTVNAANEKDAEKPRKEKKKAKKQESERLVANKPLKEVVAAPEPDKKRQQQQVIANNSAPMDVASTSKFDAKPKTKKASEKKQKEKHDKKNDLRQPKEIASGVVAVKQFKKAKPHRNAVDLTQMNFTPDVGFGGSSTWD